MQRKNVKRGTQTNPYILRVQITYPRQSHPPLLLRWLLYFIFVLTLSRIRCQHRRRKRARITFSTIYTRCWRQWRFSPFLSICRCGIWTCMCWMRGAWSGDGDGVVVRNRMELEGMLLDVMRGENLVERDKGAVAVTRGHHQALTV